MDLTDSSNQRLLIRSIPVRSAPNGLLFGWDLALYRGRQHYSTLDVAPADWEDHWLQAFCPLYDLEAADQSVCLVALLRDTNWKFDACARQEGRRALFFSLADLPLVKSRMMKENACGPFSLSVA